jgi:type IV secretory pathway TraG/TraD family ATPase VirD4
MEHHTTELLIALFVVLFTAGLVRLVIGNPNSARHRVRVLRWRIRLYLRPGPGYANIAELMIRWSRLRAVVTGRRSRPSLPWWALLILPVTYYAVRLGRAHLGRRVIASMEEQTLVIAAPRAGKSGWLADRIIDHPGAVVSTSTRADLLDNTARIRGQHGHLHVFNPEGIGGIASTFRWNPVEGCQHPAIALQRAAAFTSAGPASGREMAFWLQKASTALAALLHAAALSGLTMNDVYRWAHGVDGDTPLKILAEHSAAAEHWLGPVHELIRPGRTSESIRMTITRALAWLGDPAIAAAITPGPGEGFDVTSFVAGRNTLYMIGTGREDAPIAPLFRAFAEYVHAGAAYEGSLQPHGRLDPPLHLALDEVTQICPVPLPQWMADSAGKGIMITAICHGLAQLEARWDRTGAQAIWDTAGVKVILGGVTDPDTLEDLSLLCGEIDLRVPTRTIDDYGRRERSWTYQAARVLPPELLRMLPEWRALVVRGNLSPVVIRLRMAWRRHDYRRTRTQVLLLHAPLPARTADATTSFPTWPPASGGSRALPAADQAWPHTPDLTPDDDAEDNDWPDPQQTGTDDTWPTSTPDEDRPPPPRRPWYGPREEDDQQ